MSELQIGKKKIGNGYPVYIIAEGCDNHMGDVEVARKCAARRNLPEQTALSFSIICRMKKCFQML